MLGQALMAASRTVEGRLVHSLHAYFLRRGDFDAPIIYEVDRSRDGGSFTSRRIVAIQHRPADLPHVRLVPGRGDGPDHQVPMPDVPPPEELPDMTAEVRKSLDGMPAERRRFWSLQRPFEYRSVEPVEAGGPRPGVRHLWFRLLKLVGIVLLVVLILVGALLPLRYTARMQLPKRQQDKSGAEPVDGTRPRGL